MNGAVGASLVVERGSLDYCTALLLSNILNDTMDRWICTLENLSKG